MSNVYLGNDMPLSMTYVSQTNLPLSVLNPTKTSTPPPSVLIQAPYSNTFDLGGNSEFIDKLKNSSTGVSTVPQKLFGGILAPPTLPPTPIANVPAKPLTSATLLTAAINTPASKRAIPNVVYQGVPNFHSAYLANNSYQMTNNGIVKQSTFVNTPMTTNAIPPGDLTILNRLAQLEQSRPQSTAVTTQPPPSFTPLSVSFDLPEESTTTDNSTYYYIAGGLLIAFFVFGRR